MQETEGDLHFCFAFTVNNRRESNVHVFLLDVTKWTTRLKRKRSEESKLEYTVIQDYDGDAYTVSRMVSACGYDDDDLSSVDSADSQVHRAWVRIMGCGISHNCCMLVQATSTLDDRAIDASDRQFGWQHVED